MRKLLVVACLFLFVPFASGQVFVNGAPTSPLPVPVVVGNILTFNDETNGTIIWDPTFTLFSLGYIGAVGQAIIEAAQYNIIVGTHGDTYPAAIFGSDGMHLGEGGSSPNDVAIVRSSSNWLLVTDSVSGFGNIMANKFASPVGVNATFEATSPTQAASTQAGVALTINAGNAVAGDTNEGAAAGGDFYVRAGNAARLTSGDARGGDVWLKPGQGIGTSRDGDVYMGFYKDVGVSVGLSGEFKVIDGDSNLEVVQASGYKVDTNVGMTTVITVRDSGGTANCTITVTGGIITATTCTHT